MYKNKRRSECTLRREEEVKGWSYDREMLEYSDDDEWNEYIKTLKSDVSNIY